MFSWSGVCMGADWRWSKALELNTTPITSSAAAVFLFAGSIGFGLTLSAHHWPRWLGVFSSTMSACGSTLIYSPLE